MQGGGVQNCRSTYRSSKYVWCSVDLFQSSAVLAFSIRFGGPHRMGDGWIFPKNLRASVCNDDLTNDLSLILVGSISLASTFKQALLMIFFFFYAKMHKKISFTLTKDARYYSA